MTTKPAPVCGETPRAQRYHYTRCHDKDDWIAANDYDALRTENERLVRVAEATDMLLATELSMTRQLTDLLDLEVTKRKAADEESTLILQRSEAAESALAAERERVIEECANCVARIRGPYNHASENADRYRIQDEILAQAENLIRALLAQPKAAPARVADGVTAIPSVDEVTTKAQSSAAPDSGEGMPEYPKNVGDYNIHDRYELLREYAVALRAYALSLREKREGWKWVPREPTIEMENAGDKADSDYSNNRFHGLGHLGRSAFVYHHMLSAAPPAEKKKGPSGEMA